ncbi:ankyrin repeat-containing domain protein [Aspergillus heterothallicus]
MGLKNDEESLLLRELTRIPNRTYLWVYLTLDFIESNIDINKAGISEITSCLPVSVNDAYEKILSRSRDSAKTRKLLQIVVAAERPLTLDEMNVALSVKSSHSSYDDLDLRPAERFRITLRDLCGLFVVVVDSKIYLLHQTAREFLVKNKQTKDLVTLQTQRWHGCLTWEDSDRMLAEICIWHLLFREFEVKPLSSETKTEDYTARHVFLDYSATFWATHLFESDIDLHDILDSLQTLCNARSGRCKTWLRIYWEWAYEEAPSRFTSLLVASYFGFDALVKVLLRTPKMNLRSKHDEFGGHGALFWAAAHGNENIVKLLLRGPVMSLGRKIRLPLRRGVCVDARHTSRQTPLIIAASEGQEAVVKLLIGKGANLELKDTRGLTALSWAAIRGEEEIAKLLIVGGADLETRDIFEQTPLLHAAEMKHKGILKLLLEKGAHTESKDDDDQTALIWTARKGQAGAMMLLLDYGADIEWRDRFGKSALSWAAQRGQKDVALLLIERGADAARKDGRGFTAINWASAGGHAKLAELLREKASTRRKVG